MYFTSVITPVYTLSRQNLTDFIIACEYFFATKSVEHANEVHRIIVGFRDGDIWQSVFPFCFRQTQVPTYIVPIVNTRYLTPVRTVAIALPA